MEEKEYIQQLAKKYEPMVKDFLGEFNKSENNEEFKLPGKTLLLGSEIFGQFELTDTQHLLFAQVKSIEHAKYILYANRKTPASIQLPINDNDVNSAVKDYEKYLDNLVKDIISDYLIQYPTSSRYMTVTNTIFKMLNLNRY